MPTDGQLTYILHYAIKATYGIYVMEHLVVEPLALAIVKALSGAARISTLL